MEEDPSFILTLVDGREIEATPNNAILFRFIGKLSMYDHAFFVTDTEESRGVYLFNVNELFEDVADYMVTHDYPLHLNLRDVAECDVDAFNTMVSNDVANDVETGVPEGWS